ncbi:DUF6531 domain-containing protein [Allostreptomyces psammosilenae]|uniref:RHS repeat-associated protein n=1 Tax=Allostreptomyces psammosilenae TaxID=1892865 RepID=A0A852ZYX4_9ACTN|nr:DUF6531 domain-containing protein [Allostreptomyces psammosilenae]NYI03482.1 RHS repeat-associated protein [Allostreptomyces psammosilenae]
MVRNRGGDGGNGGDSGSTPAPSTNNRPDGGGDTGGTPAPSTPPSSRDGSTTPGGSGAPAPTGDRGAQVNPDDLDWAAQRTDEVADRAERARTNLLNIRQAHAGVWDTDELGASIKGPYERLTETHDRAAGGMPTVLRNTGTGLRNDATRRRTTEQTNTDQMNRTRTNSGNRPGPGGGPGGGSGGVGNSATPAGTSPTGRGPNATNLNNGSTARNNAADPDTTRMPPGARCPGGDPVDVATGEVFMTQRDVRLPASLPLVVERTHVSSYRAGRFFGRSWASTLDQRLELDSHGVCFTRSDGVILVYPVPRPGVAAMPVAGPRWPLTWDGVPGAPLTVSDPRAGHTYHFAALPTPQHNGAAAVLPLRAISDRNGNRVEVDHDEEGVPTALRHSGGYHVMVESSGGRVTALRLRDPAAEDGTTPILRYGYDTAGDLAEVVNSSGLPFRFTYDPAGRITSWTDRNGTSYHYTYDPAGRCVRGTGSDGFLDASFEYDAAGRTTRVTNSLGHTTTYHLNDRHQIIREVDPLGAVTVSEWDEYDRLLLRTDPLGRTTRLTYDVDGNLDSVTRPDGTVSAAAYNDLHLPVVLTDPDGAQWRHDYDDRGNLLATTDPAGATTRYDYDERGLLIRVTDAMGHSRGVRTDAAGLPVLVTDPLGASVRIDRDAFGRVTTVTDAMGTVTRYHWTVEGKPARRVRPDGAFEEWVWDGEGNLRAHTDPTGHVTRHSVGHFRLPTARSSQDGSGYQFAYDTELRLVSVTNPQGLVWRYSYDAAGRLVAETDFNGRTLTYTHDDAGQLTARTNGVGQVITYRWDVLGRVIERTAGDTRIAYSHDAAGRLLAATDQETHLAFTRDALGRPLTESVNGRVISYEYDSLGRRVRRVTPTGVTSSWGYDAAGRATGLTTAGHRLSFSYDAAGRETFRRLDDGGVSLTQAWDVNHRLTEQVLSLGAEEHGAGRVLQRRRYQYRADGILTGIEDLLAGPRSLEVDLNGRVTAIQAHGWSERYAYDSAGRLVSADYPQAESPSGGGSTPAIERSYAGTLLRRAGRTSYVYDAQGRVIRRDRRTLSGRRDVWHYTWDADDRLREVTTPDGDTWRYSYDPLGRRIAKARLTADGEELERVEHTWDGTRLAEQLHTGVTRRATATTWEWSPGTHRPLSQTDRAWSSELPQEVVDRRFRAIVTDLIGTPAELVDPDGRVTRQGQRNLWGHALPTSGDDGECPLGFPGQYFDAETGCYYNLARHYDPEAARYLGPDPLGLWPAPDHHAYVPNPTAWADPLGLQRCTTIPDDVMEHVLHGNFNADGEFGGWHLYPGATPEEYPEGRYIRGNLIENTDGTWSVRGEVGAYDAEWNMTPKIATAGHTFFPSSWKPADIAEAGRALFERGEYSHGGTIVTYTHNGVSMTGFLSKGPDGVYRPSTFFPDGG